MSKKTYYNELEEMIPSGSKDLFGFLEVDEEEPVKEVPQDVGGIEDNPDDEPKEEPEGDVDKLKNILYKYLKEQSQDLKDDMAELASEFSPNIINQMIENLQYEDKTWQNLLILDLWGVK